MLDPGRRLARFSIDFVSTEKWGKAEYQTLNDISCTSKILKRAPLSRFMDNPDVLVLITKDEAQPAIKALGLGFHFDGYHTVGNCDCCNGLGFTEVLAD